MQESDAKEAMYYALRVLGLRSHSQLELGRKLSKKGYQEESIELVMAKLTGMGVLDDRLFAEELLRSRSRRKPSGKLKIRIELRNKGVPESIIGEVLGDYDALELCRKAAEKRIGSLYGATPADRKKKLDAFLRNRGFEWQEIQEVLKQHFNAGTDQEDQW